jgi:glutamine phosphoribosylpyrophosphate amidotransferase
LGAALAREHPVDADMVIGVPDSATAAAIGYAHASGIPFRSLGGGVHQLGWGARRRLVDRSAT